MDRLILFRHGKAEADSASGDDFDRRLAPRGVRESAAMGRSLAELGMCPDLVLASPSARTRETWAAAAEVGEIGITGGAIIAGAAGSARTIFGAAGAGALAVVVGAGVVSGGKACCASGARRCGMAATVSAGRRPSPDSRYHPA